MKNFDLNKNEYNQKDSSKSIIELFNYDKDMSSLLFNSIKDIESTFGYKILYFINRKINDLTLEQNEYEKIFFAIFDKNNSNKLIEILCNRFNMQMNHKYIISWIQSNLLTFGEWLKIFKHLNKELQYLIIGSYKGINWNIRQFLIIFKELNLLRNMCAHNKTIFNLKINLLDYNVNFISDFILKNDLKMKIKNKKLKLFDMVLIIEKISNRNISINLKLIFTKKIVKKIIESEFISNVAKDFILKIIGIE